MQTMASGPIWGGLALHPMEAIPAGVEALIDFTTHNAADPYSNVQFVVGHQPRFGGGVGITLASNMAGIEKPRLLQRFLELPEIMNNYKTVTLQKVLTYSSLPPNY